MKHRVWQGQITHNWHVTPMDGKAGKPVRATFVFEDDARRFAEMLEGLPAQDTTGTQIQRPEQDLEVEEEPCGVCAGTVVPPRHEVTCTYHDDPRLSEAELRQIKTNAMEPVQFAYIRGYRRGRASRG